MNRLRIGIRLLAGVAALVVLGARSEGAELANDGWSDGSIAAFQAGFVANEIGAVRLVPPATPMQVASVRFLFGGAAGVRNVVLHVWDDSPGTLEPGAELFAGEFQLTASDTALQEIDLGAESILVSGPFRVGVELLEAGLPSLARDEDGTIDASRNFLLAQGLGWVPSANLGLTGDWVIRAVVVPEPRAAGAALSAGLVLAWLARRRVGASRRRSR